MLCSRVIYIYTSTHKDYKKEELGSQLTDSFRCRRVEDSGVSVLFVLVVLHLFSVCVCPCMTQCACETRRECAKSVLAFPHLGPRDRTQVVRLGHKCFDSLTRLALLFLFSGLEGKAKFERSCRRHLISYKSGLFKPCFVITQEVV